MADTEPTPQEIVATMADVAKSLKAMADRVENQGVQEQHMVIHAGGVTNAAAVCIAVTSLALVVVFGILMAVQFSNLQSEQRAWVGVWQQTVAKAAADQKAN